MIVPCTAGKRAKVETRLKGLRNTTQKTLGEAWLAQLETAQATASATELYKGRAFQIALSAAEAIGGDFGIVSAGLGFVVGETKIPSYDITVRPRGPNSVATHVGADFDPKAWWKTVSAGPYAADFQASLSDRPLVLVGLSAAYAPMISDDLEGVGDGLRIFGLSIERTLPSSLHRYVMPYDARLESLGRPGTRVDFASRALLHFVEKIVEDPHDLEVHRDRVENSMAGGTLPPKRPQQRLTDRELKAMIERLIARLGPRSTAILRYMRGVEGVSCEQRRFADAYRAVRGA